jgi:hypothetical protein
LHAWNGPAKPGLQATELGSSSAAPEHPEDEEQDYGAEERDDDAAEQAYAALDEEPGYEAAQERADQADDKVTDEAEPVASADYRRRPTGDESNDDPRDDATRRKVHKAPPSK